MKDIGIELYEAISAEFQRELNADKIIGGIMQRIESGKAQSTDIARYANRLGQMLRRAIERNVSADKLPDGQMYYNIAEKILRPSLKNTYDLFNDTASEIQAVVDQALGINIKAQKPEFPDERIDDVIGAASVKGIPEEQMIRRLASPAENITQSYAEDYAKVNADFRSRAGLTEYIIRRDDGNCCEWCGKLAGKYRYPDEVPKDVYRRHDNCGCTTEHFSDGTKTDVWSKQSSTISAEDRERMAQLAEKRPTGFTPEEAAAKEAEVKAQIKGKLEPEEAERLEKELLEKQKLITIANTPITTVEQANDYLNSVFASVEKNMAALDKQLVIDNAEQLRKLNAKFGVLSNDNRGFISGSKLTKNAVACTSWGVRAPHNLTMSSKFYYSADVLIYAEKQCRDAFWSMPFTDNYLTTYSVTHEYGHMLALDIIKDRIEPSWYEEFKSLRAQRMTSTAQAMERKELKKQSRALWDEITDIARKNNPDFKVSKKTLSQYGFKSTDEAFAETFANSQCGSPNELGKAMLVFLERMGYR